MLVTGNHDIPPRDAFQAGDHGMSIVRLTPLADAYTVAGESPTPPTPAAAEALSRTGHPTPRTAASDASAAARHAEFVGMQQRVAADAPSEAARRHGRARSRWGRRVVPGLVGAIAVGASWAGLVDAGDVRTDLVRWIDESANGQPSGR